MRVLHDEAGVQRSTFGADSRFDDALDEPKSLTGSAVSRWTGWRWRLLATSALFGCIGILALVLEVASWPVINASWHEAAGEVELSRSADPELQALRGRRLIGVGGEPGRSAAPVAIDAGVLQRSMRWLIDDAERTRQIAHHEQLSTLLAAPQVSLLFADGEVRVVAPLRDRLTKLPALFWLLSALGLGLFLVAMVVVLAQPSSRNLLYALMACCQAVNVLFIAIEMSFDLGQPARFAQLDMPVRAALDLLSAAALVHAVTLHPRRLPGARWAAIGGWAVALAVIALVVAGVPGTWWWAQAGIGVLGLAVIGLLSWSYRIEPHPVAIMLRRFGVVALGTWLLLTAAVAAAPQLTDMPPSVAAIGSMVWYVFLGSLLMLVPFLAKSHLVMREFSLLAAISTIATALDLLFVAVFSLGQFAALTLSLFLSLAVYSGIRQWVMTQLMLGNGMLTTERMFEQLYRIAREVELHPERTPALLSLLLRQLFEPMEARIIDRETAASRIAGDGSTLLVPVPHLTGDADASRTSILMRFAQRGRRLFTPDDARLTERIVEQLRRAVAFDQAVEQGRKEERLRIAQDLHDDIGARLLTLMYTAQSPEMEDYLRHTLQDLKTLTRGLAAANHRLSHSAAEWKADLTGRLTAAQIELKWSANFDDDVLLTVVHWSAITRVLRELASNAIAHAQAEKVEIDMSLQKNRFELTVADNGVGRDPGAWSHGLGLGGVRKRVKQLGGQVEWHEVSPRGIGCRVVIRSFSGEP